VENAGGKVYGKATGLYNKHCKYSEQGNPWHPFRSAHDFQQAQSFSQQTKTWIDHHLRHGLDNFKIESFQSAYAMRKLLSELDFGLGDDSWNDDHSHIFGTLYLVLATVPDRHIRSGSGSKPNRCQIGHPACQKTRSVHFGTV